MLRSPPSRTNTLVREGGLCDVSPDFNRRRYSTKPISLSQTHVIYEPGDRSSNPRSQWAKFAAAS
jgi:hypothetical protein